MTTSIKTFAIRFIISTAAMSTSAQTAGSEHTPPNIEVLSQKWSKVAVVQVTDRPDYDVIPAPTGSSPPPRIRTLQATRYVYEAKVRNTGDRDIRAMRWDYVFVDPDTQEEIERRRFYSTVTIHPNHEKTLEGYTRSAPSAIVSARSRLSEWSSSASLFRTARPGGYPRTKENAAPTRVLSLRRNRRNPEIEPHSP